MWDAVLYVWVMIMGVGDDVYKKWGGEAQKDAQNYEIQWKIYTLWHIGYILPIFVFWLPSTMSFLLSILFSDIS